MKERISEEQMQCKDCQWYSPEWHECCFGGGWGHYPDPDDWCERYFDVVLFKQIHTTSNKKVHVGLEPWYDRLERQPKEILTNTKKKASEETL